MRSLLLTLALLLASCATTLQSQALVVVTASQVVKAAGDAIQAKSDAAFDAAPTAAEKADVYAKWSPVVAKYQMVKSLVLAYESAIAKADADGDTSIVQAPARELVAAWVQLAALAADAGISIAGPPAELTAFAGGS